MLYQVAIIEEAAISMVLKSGEQNAELAERLVFGPKAICALNKTAAAVLATKEADLDSVDEARMKVLVTPFVPKK